MLVENRAVRRGSEVIPLTPTEFRLLGALMKQRGRTCSHKMLLNEVWGADSTGRVHYVRVYIRFLRQKLELDPERPRLLVTVRGAGYRFVDAEEAQPPSGTARRARSYPGASG